MKFFRLLTVMLLIISMAGVPIGCRGNSTDQTTAQVETAQIETAQVETAQIETAQVETAQTETAQVETSPADKSPQTAGAPELFIAERSHRFSNVVAGQSVSHDFIIKNRGTAPLHISRVKTG